MIIISFHIDYMNYEMSFKGGSRIFFNRGVGGGGANNLGYRGRGSNK